MKQIHKTNAMRIADQAGIPYQIHTYPHHEHDPVDGKHVAALLRQDEHRVCKTLLMRGHSKQIYVFVIPILYECDLKKCARAVREKSVEMIAVKEMLAISGYIRGGCSPIGMKKQYPTVLDIRCMDQTTIYVSGGKIGIQMEMNPNDIAILVQAETADLCKEIL